MNDAVKDAGIISNINLDPWGEGDIGYLRNKLLPTLPYDYSKNPEELLELEKCKNDICYFAEKYFTIVSLDLGKIHIPLYDYQKRLLLQLQRERYSIILQSRQSGKTTTNTILLLHYALFNSDKFIAILANKEKAAKMILARIKMAFELLPRFLKPRVTEWNKLKIEFANGCTMEAGATSSSSIRGESVNILFIDECAIVEGWEEFYASTYSTVTAGTQTKIILNSTANGMNHYYHLWMGAKYNMLGTNPEMANEFVPFEVTWRDVPNRDEAWRKQTIHNTSEEQFMQEHENHFAGGQNTLIRAGILNSLVPMRPLHITGEGTKIYKYPQKGHEYVILVDTSHGKGLDYHAFSVIDITQYPFEQVAVFRNNELSTLLYPNVIHVAARQYNMAYVLIETNDLGGMVATDMNHDMEYENILSPRDSGINKTQRAYELGIRMSASVKSVGCSNLRDLLEQRQLILHDQDTMNELATFVARGKSYQADPKIADATDDCVMTLVLFGWLIKTNLFNEIFENKMLKEDMFKQRIDDIEQSLLPEIRIEDGLNDDGDAEYGHYDSNLGMYEVVNGNW